MKIINQSPLKTQQGFTLIELVVVIVILGILAATAAPKFIDLTGDAQASTIKAVRGSVESATTMVHAKVLVKGATAEATVAIDDSTTIAIVNGWPASTVAAWGDILDISANDFLSAVDGTTGTDGRIVFYPGPTAVADAAAAVTAGCYVSYTESASSNTRPAILAVTDGC
ncbi:prepilin-type N-terminal cleavage/methylation domain-containing protein [Pseudocolwellia sp. AS88]|uniref:type II secretion system protein n=1 Tax=Pseudocolwellia sp. AS88 TaxID=3063958 RepID=UPI0026E9AE16|nr:prepilin-type N-terminal cleavage/methylation domain-containing protein [Pseudocolwellia sp. AS88]MDO7084312.1 prepilin-type N-terminal cleavage/methylation domain-containing protein [Pseudocolwellia sp. AS88]